ncbi:MAG: ABC transporter ATP-binding protein [Bacteroidetes bacterium]|nr:ABC transporter ATP-binding protein [Bacteroidota bacterium]
MDIVLSAKDINKHFFDPIDNHVLKDVSLQINRGEFVSIMGKSGCGKSTLLYILSTMDTNYEGNVELHHQNLRGLKNTELAAIRNKRIGFVFQFHYLLPEFSVLDNVMLPALRLGEKDKDEIEHDAMEKLKMLDISETAKKLATRISGGQKQRVAIARSLINDPDIIMGDEPTGNLDSKNSDVVFDIFRNISSGKKQSILVVTHDLDFAKRTDRIIEMADGRIIH